MTWEGGLIYYQGIGEGLGKAAPFFERLYLTGNFYLYHIFSVIVALPQLALRYVLNGV